MRAIGAEKGIRGEWPLEKNRKEAGGNTRGKAKISKSATKGYFFNVETLKKCTCHKKIVLTKI